MKFAPFLLFILSCTSAMAQKILPLEAIRPLYVLVDSLSDAEVLDFEETYILGYDADSGFISFFIEQFYCGTFKKTPDETLSWVRLSDIDPETIALKEDSHAFGLIFFTGDNKRSVHTVGYEDKATKWHIESDRMHIRFWYKEADRDLLLKIRAELIRLIHLVWDGKPPKYETDIHKPAEHFLNGEKVIWQEGPVPENTSEN